MKSYNNLFCRMLTEEYVRKAISNAAKKKNKNRRRHRRLKDIALHADDYIDVVKNWLCNFEPAEHKPIIINDGINAKKRKIIVPTVEEEVVHHAAVNILREIMMPSMYEHSYASIPGRGIHKGVKRIRRWIANDRANTRYCLKLDIRKFFDSVDQDVLLKMLRKAIRDKRFYGLVEKIIRSVPEGLPLGFVTSQWFANYLLTPLDHKIKGWGAKYYIRFMDDMVIFGSNKRELHRLFDKIREYIENVLHLEVKGNWQIFYMDNDRGKKTGRALDFLGFRFYRNHVGLRRKLAIKMHRKAKRISKKGRTDIHDARQIVTYAGYTKYANVYGWYQSRVKPYVSLRQMRKRISQYDRRRLLNVV